MVPQNHPGLPIVFRKEGCRARSLMAMSEIHIGKPLTMLQIELAVASAEQDPNVMCLDATTGPDEHKITMYASKLLRGTSSYFRQIGERKGNDFFDWSGNAITPDLIAFTVLHWITDFQSGHWTLGDNIGVEIFDPWSTAIGFNPWDMSGKTGYTINKKSVDKAYAYRLFEGA